MTHVFGLGELLDVPGAGALCDRGLQALAGLLHDDDHGGWWSAVDADGTPTQTRKSAYDHAFVLLAATTAVQAGRPGAETLLRQAIDVIERHFWDDDAGALVDTWDADWSAARALPGRQREHARRRGVPGRSRRHGRRRVAHPGHPDRRSHRQPRGSRRRLARTRALRRHWTPQPDYARETPADPFRPYGATIGHGLEWSRLLVHLDAALALHATDDARAEAAEDAAEPWLVAAARSLFDTAVGEGWAADGSAGFVYTVDWDGVPVVRQRMHWVVAEAVAAAAVLYQVTGEGRYRELYDTWWAYAREHLVDDERGRWWHELDADQRPARTVWSGKPDVYHALQATLVPRLPLAPTLAAALAARRR